MYLLQALGEQDNSLSSPLQGPQLFSSSALQHAEDLSQLRGVGVALSD